MKILVYADWVELGRPHLMGTLSVTHIKGRGVISFEYNSTWLQSGFAQIMDPDLQLFSGPQYLPMAKKNYGLFMDSSPDRWGRLLMDRREAISAKLEARKTKNLFEEDYLLGVFDSCRMGALRFKTEETGPFLNDDAVMASPPWASLRELEFASLQLEKDMLPASESLRWINMLIAPGASLGGARPKASVADIDNSLWIAKFPSVEDKVDIGGWEMVVNLLAEKAGLTIPKCKVQKYNSKKHTFLSKRFDRNSDGRIHFASAMTLLGLQDGDVASYLDLATILIRNGLNPQLDLEELWRRIVFNICVKNTDDHLRNHGFLLTPGGWILSPAYDINPVYFGSGLALNISETDNSLDLDLAKSVARLFRVSERRTDEIIGKIIAAVKDWRLIAKRLRIPASEQDLMAAAFELVEGKEK
jgi:serine/threonine-protein kinase HipA